MKRFFSILLLTAVFCGFAAGCGAKGSEGSASGNRDTAADEVTVQKQGDENVVKQGDAEIRVSNKYKKSVDLPDNYPSADLPVYKGCFVAVAGENADKSFGLLCFSKDSAEKVIEFYKDVLKDTQELSNTSDGNNYSSVGMKNGYTYTVAVNEGSEMEDYSTTIIITLMPVAQYVPDNTDE